MKDFTVITFSSDLSQEYYGYWFSRISQLFHTLEQLTVIEGLRTLCITSVSENKYEEFKQFLSQHNLYHAIIGRMDSKQTYSAISSNTGDILRVLVSSKPLDGLEFDDITVGTLLGYPEEDILMFKQYFIDKQLHDPTWYQVSDEFKVNETTKVLGHWSLLNTLLRWFGVRLVPHLPFNFYSENNYRIANMFLKTMIKHGFEQEARMAELLLGGEIEYSTLNGVGIVKTKLFELVFYSPNYEKGKKFVIKQEGPTIDDADLRLWTLNEFNSYLNMHFAHEQILLVLKVLKLQDVCDLGAGNGVLLFALPGRKILYEKDYSKIIWHNAAFPSSDVEFINADISNFGNENVDTYIISIMRLKENKQIARKILEILKTTNKQFVIYTYQNQDATVLINELELFNLKKFIKFYTQSTFNGYTVSVAALTKRTVEVDK